MTSVLVIDDHPLVLQGCRRVLEDIGADHIRLASSPIDGFKAYRSHRPDLIIVDLAMNRGVLAGLSFIRRLRTHDKSTPILVLTMHDDPLIASQALRLGANGYVLKDASSDDLIKAITSVRQGRSFLSHSVASSIALMETRGRNNPLQSMTLRELQTLELIAQGKSYSAIAEELHISYKTVANTCTQIKSKLGVKSLPEMMRIAIDHLPEITGDRTSKRLPKGSLNPSGW